MLILLPSDLLEQISLAIVDPHDQGHLARQGVRGTAMAGIVGPKRLRQLLLLLCSESLLDVCVLLPADSASPRYNSDIKVIKIRPLGVPYHGIV